MNSYEKNELQAKREYLVVKSNNLIQNSRFHLSLTEQKVIAFICSMIKPVKTSDDENNSLYQLEYDFNICEYCKVCGIDYNAGKNYSDIKAVLKKLADRSMWIQIGNEEVLCRWLAKVRTNKRSGMVHIELDKDLAPFLFDLGKRFTQYQLYNILAMKSSFSVRIYELLRSYAYQKSKIFDIDELKKILCIDNEKSYRNFADFRRNVLEISQAEINEMTDLTISFEPITKGRKVIRIKFQIGQKNPIQRLIAGNSVHDRLGIE